MNRCPRCRVAMRDHVRANAHASSCHTCGGVFLAADVNETVRVALDDDAQALAQEAGRHVFARVQFGAPAACPVCAVPMRRFRVGPVEVDTCFEHGSFYDRGELQRVRAALEAGASTHEVAPAAADSGLDLTPVGAKVKQPLPRIGVAHEDGGPPLNGGAPPPGGGAWVGIPEGVQKKINKLARREQREARRDDNVVTAISFVDDVLDFFL